jgi:DNA polymerase III delta prime subunit
MDEIDMNYIFERSILIENIRKILQDFDNNSFKKGIYIYGPPGCGKTYMIFQILKSLDYDIISYNAGDIRNHSLFNEMDSNHLSNRNVLDLMNRKQRRIAIVMDEIDGMNSGDKGGIDQLIKLIRPKKTKKQKMEGTTVNPIICIGSINTDKKTRELIKACQTFELKPPTKEQITKVISTIMTNYSTFSSDLRNDILHYIQGDLRKLKFLIKLYKNKPELIKSSIIRDVLQVKLFNEDAKNITWKLFEKSVPLIEHNRFMNETERTTVALLWHENIADTLSKLPSQTVSPFYLKILNNMCFADYVGRVTFQSQIWQFNEMTSLIKTFYNNKLCHDYLNANCMKRSADSIEFTKILTKYSTEYNNKIFLQSLCQKLNLDRNDMMLCFQEFRFLQTESYTNNMCLEDIFSKYDVSILDIKRIYRFLDKNGGKNDNNLMIEDD